MLLLVVALAAAGLLVPVPAAADTGPTCGWRRATIVGTGGDDRLHGTAGSDVIVGFAGDDRIFGRGGHDFICGNGGEDYVEGGTGHDRIWGGPAGDSLHGGAGNDYIDGGKSHDRLSGGSGADVLHGRTEIDDLDGGTGADRLFGGGGVDRIQPGRGRDHVNGGPGCARPWRPWAGCDKLDLSGLPHGARVDLVRGELITPDGRGTVAEVEDVIGTPYRDVLKGDEGRNFLDQGWGVRGPEDPQDLLVGRGGDDYLDGYELLGGAGNDTMYGTWYGQRSVGHAGNDFFYIPTVTKGPRTATGGQGSDRFVVADYCRPGWCPADEIRIAGGEGRDRFLVGVADDDDWGQHDEPIRIDLRAGLISSSSGMRVHVRDFEEVVGSENDDTIVGTDGPEYLMGGTGDDTIQGWGGNDRLAGGTRGFDNGTDTIRGGRGSNDVCYTSSPPHAVGPPDDFAGCETYRGVPVAR